MASDFRLPYLRLSSFYFLFFLGIGAFLPYWPLYLESIGMSVEQIGILSAVIVGTKIISNPVWGWVVDYTGRPVFFVRLCLVCAVLGFLPSLFYQDFIAIFLTLLFFSVFWNAALPQMEGVTLSYLGKETKSYTTIRVWGSIGFIVAVLILGEYFLYYPLQYLPLILLALFILVGIDSFFIPEYQFKTQSYATSPSFRSILMCPSVCALMLVCFFVQASHGIYYAFFSIYLQEHGYTNNWIGLIWSLGVVAEVLVYCFIHTILGHIKLYHLMILTLILSVIRWLLLAYFVESLPILIFAQSLHAASFGIYHAVAIQYIHREFIDHQGKGQSIYSSVSFGAGIAFGSVLGGYLWSEFTVASIFLSAAFFSIIALISSFKLARY